MASLCLSINTIKSTTSNQDAIFNDAGIFNQYNKSETHTEDECCIEEFLDMMNIK